MDQRPNCKKADVTLKLLEEKKTLAESFLICQNNIFGSASETNGNKAEINRWNLIKLKNFYTAKGNSERK